MKMAAITPIVEHLAVYSCHNICNYVYIRLRFLQRLFIKCLTQCREKTKKSKGIKRERDNTVTNYSIYVLRDIILIKAIEALYYRSCPDRNLSHLEKRNYLHFRVSYPNIIIV